jgi:hypothetical protein
MSENTRSLPESLSVAHLPLWQLRQHLIDVTLELAEVLVHQGDVGRLKALTELYQITVDALHDRGWDSHR